MPPIHPGRESGSGIPIFRAWTFQTTRSAGIFDGDWVKGNPVTEELQPESLRQIIETELPDDADDEGEYLAEAQEFEEGAEALRLEDRRELLKGRKQDRRERKRYAELVFRLVCWWLVGVIALVCCSGLGALELGEMVLVTIVGSTTASVVAIFVVVAKYLFPPRI